MDRSEFMQFAAGMFQASYKTMQSKNADYGRQDDPWADFRAAEACGVQGELAIIARMMDKMVRIANVIRAGKAAVADETVRDTCGDLVNLSVLLAGMCVDRADRDEDGAQTRLIAQILGDRWREDEPLADAVGRLVGPAPKPTRDDIPAKKFDQIMGGDMKVDKEKCLVVMGKGPVEQTTG